MKRGTPAGRTEDLEEIEFEATILQRHLTPGHEMPGRTLERSAYTLLTRLTIEGPLSLGQLSEAFGLDVSTLNRQTARLVEQGLLARIPDPEGGLARKFAPTDLGRERLAADRTLRQRAIGEILLDWDASDVAAFARLLRRFNAAVEERDGRPWPRQP